MQNSFHLCHIVRTSIKVVVGLHCACCYKMQYLFVCVMFLPIGCLTFQWPCGIVVNIVEMFNFESKSQVYGHLNKIMAKENMSGVGKWSS